MQIQTLKVLIVDDESELRKSISSILVNILPDLNFQIEEACNGQEATQKIHHNDFDLVLMDVRMPEMSGLEALKLIKEHDPRTFVVIMTAHSNLQDAITAIKDGAYDYLEKPVNPQKLAEIVRKGLAAKELVSKLALSNPIFDDDVDSDFVGISEKMKEVFSLIYKLCKVDTTVLIRGENGTGKELVAKAIHYNSPRKNGSFVAINCGAIPENLMETELFGHEKGAFTGAIERKIGKFQLANNGTLFLDEIGELRIDMQVKLLRVLQDKKFVPVGGTREVKTNTRIIAATNRNLEKMIEESTFREDLFYRLSVMPIFLPPLRDREDDIPALVQHFIKKFMKSHNSSIQGIHPMALEILKRYRWPGNIRELENAVERSFIVETSQQISVDSLPDHIRSPKQPASTETSSGFSKGNNSSSSSSSLALSQSSGSSTTSLGQNNSTSSSGAGGGAAGAAGNSLTSPLNFEVFKEQSEKDFIISALKSYKGRINQTVAHANIPKNTLLRKIKKYSINVKDYLE